MRIAVAALLLIQAMNANAAQCTRADTAREIVYQSLAAIDWMQTQDIARHYGYHETNIILGKHPNNARINTYFALTGIAHYAVATMLPEKYRAPFQYISIGVEVGAVYNNWSVGLHLPL